MLVIGINLHIPFLIFMLYFCNFLFQLHSLYETAFPCTRFSCFYFNTLISVILYFYILETVNKSDHPV